MKVFQHIMYISVCVFVCTIQTKFADVIMINRYYGWYKNMGYPKLIPYELSYDLEQWQNVEKKPMMISEYGASTIAGFHQV